MTESPVIDIVVREANTNDFDFVADLMIRALTPFYDGDHRAHARRIFETHMNGGIDHVGHFSAGQHMFIAEQALRQEKQLRVDRLIAEVVTDYTLLAKTRGMTFTVDARPTTICANRDMVRHIISNLVSNAVRHSDSSGIGLYTVKMLLDTKGLDYDFTPHGQGMRFVVRFG